MFTTETTIKEFWNNYFETDNCTLQMFEDACKSTDLASDLKDYDYWFSAKELFEQYESNKKCSITAKDERNFISIEVVALDKSFGFETSISFEYSESELFNNIVDACSGGE